MYLSDLCHKWQRLEKFLNARNSDEILLLLRIWDLASRVIHRCNFRICIQVSIINDIFVDILCQIL